MRKQAAGVGTGGAGGEQSSRTINKKGELKKKKAVDKKGEQHALLEIGKRDMILEKRKRRVSV